MKKRLRNAAHNEGLEDALLVVAADGFITADNACDYYLDLSTETELPKSFHTLIRAEKGRPR